MALIFEDERCARLKTKPLHLFNAGRSKNLCGLLWPVVMSCESLAFAATGERQPIQTNLADSAGVRNGLYLDLHCYG